jgi:ubiquinone biosynthesis protein
LTASTDSKLDPPRDDPGDGHSNGTPRTRLLASAVGHLAADSLFNSSVRSEAVDSSDSALTKARQRAHRLRQTLEKLGPFYIKIGQILSTRPDLVSDVMVAELENLHQNVEASPFAGFAAVLDREVSTWRSDFRSIDVVRPLGSASLAQVYRVTLADGRPAVVKIQRPRIRSLVRRDMKMLRRTARLFGRLAPRFNELVDVEAMLQVIFNGMEPELDFTLEAKNMDDARHAVKGFKHLTVPKVIMATPSVLVQTLAPGVSIGDADPAAFDRRECKKIGRDLLTFMFRSYFTEHSFHADPHPGNIFVHPGEKANLIDWGMVGRIDRNLSLKLILVLLGIAQNDAAATARGWVGMGRPTSRADVYGFACDMSMLVPKIATASLDELNFGVTLSRVLVYSTRRGIYTNPHISLLGKSFANIEGSVRNLAPELSVVKVFEKAMGECLTEIFAEFVSMKQAGRFAIDLMLGSGGAIDHARTILHDIANRDFALQVGLKQVGRSPRSGVDAEKLTHVALGAVIGILWSRLHRPDG